METKMPTLKDEVEAVFNDNNVTYVYSEPLYQVIGEHENLLAVTKQLTEQLSYECDNKVLGRNWETEGKIIDSLMVFAINASESNRGFLIVTKTATENVYEAGKELMHTAFKQVTELVN